MFPGDSGTEVEVGCLRGRKRRKTITIRGSYSATIEENYELMLYLDEGSCNEELEYQPISVGEK